MISAALKRFPKSKKYLEFPNILFGTLDTYLREHGEPGLCEDQKAVWRNGVDTSRFGSEEANSKRLNFERNSI